MLQVVALKLLMMAITQLIGPVLMAWIRGMIRDAEMTGMPGHEKKALVLDTFEAAKKEIGVENISKNLLNAAIEIAVVEMNQSASK